MPIAFINLIYATRIFQVKLNWRFIIIVCKIYKSRLLWYQILQLLYQQYSSANMKWESEVIKALTNVSDTAWLSCHDFWILIQCAQWVSVKRPKTVQRRCLINRRIKSHNRNAYRQVEQTSKRNAKTAFSSGQLKDMIWVILI